ncbi:MAG: methyltransferase protein [Marmoricola sp.]|nr:methyltransferase protein [Marmoricola sp.]
MADMERPLERRASVRTAVVWEACRSRLDLAPGQTVLDIGGGTGELAVRIAELGHRVTVIDPSPDALAALGRRAADRGVAGRVEAQQGDIASLADLVPDGSVDLVLCHEVLGLVTDPAAALGSIARTLRPGGALSVVVSQRHAAVLARAMGGHFVQAKELLDADPAGERRFTADELRDLLAAGGFSVSALQAVRVFTGLVPSTLLDIEPGAVAGLLELERAVAGRPEYLALAAQVHAIAVI